MNKYKFYVLACILVAGLAPFAVVGGILIAIPSLAGTDQGIAVVLITGLITFGIFCRITLEVITRKEWHLKIR